MTVYVDPLCKYGDNTPWKSGLACHMYADSTEELEALARVIRLKPSWIQKSVSGIIHYDLNESKRDAAVMAGAIEMPREHIAALNKKMREEKQRLTRDQSEGK